MEQNDINKYYRTLGHNLMIYVPACVTPSLREKLQTYDSALKEEIQKISNTLISELQKTLTKEEAEEWKRELDTQYMLREINNMLFLTNSYPLLTLISKGKKEICELDLIGVIVELGWEVVKSIVEEAKRRQEC